MERGAGVGFGRGGASVEIAGQSDAARCAAGGALDVGPGRLHPSGEHDERQQEREHRSEQHELDRHRAPVAARRHGRNRSTGAVTVTSTANGTSGSMEMTSPETVTVASVAVRVTCTDRVRSPPAAWSRNWFVDAV